MTIVEPGTVTPINPAAQTTGGVGLRMTGGSVPTVVVTSTGSTKQVTGLQPSNTYRVRVRAVDAAGNASGWSDELVFVTTAVPTTPTPAVVPGTTVIPTPKVLSPAPATVAGATVVAAPTIGVARTVLTAGTTGTVTGLSPGQQYTARVRARDAAGNWSDYSTPVVFTTASAGTVSASTVQATTTFPARTVGGTPPTVAAGRDRPVAVGSTVALDVTATPPGGQTIIGYNWVIVSGAGSLTASTTATPTYVPPGSGSGLAVVRATVSATNGGQATADLTVSYGPTVVAAENTLTGTPRATWDLTSPNLGGIATLQGFCDGFSIDRTGTASFKIAQSDGAGWTAEVFRLGYYNDNGARSYGTLTPNGTQLTASQTQPAPGDADPVTTRLSADAGNWATTLTWSPPAWAPSGMYVLRLNRTGGGASHVLFIVRDDARRAALMLMPSDSTWNAYNAWGGMGTDQYTGNSLYYGVNVDQYNADCARYVSYNRPMVNRGACDVGRDYGAVEWSTFFTSEYPMVRFLERNGIDVKYYGCVDAGGDTSGTHLRGNGSTRGGVNAAMFVGHNEYWSNVMRQGWEAARDNGVSVFSAAGNEVFWRTVGASPDVDGRPRVFECFKSTIAARASTGRTDWTGTWRDPDGTGKGGNNPENTFTGTIFTVNGPNLKALAVPFAGGYSTEPIWRNTSVASLTTGQTYTSPSQILGFEWDTYGPAGTDSAGATYMAAPHPRARYCSNVTYAISGDLLIDAGDVYGSGNATHRLVVYPGGLGGMVFGTGTVNWALGCDNANTYQQGGDNTSTVIQQATLNMLTDMGAPPTTIIPGLVQPTLVDWYIDAQGPTVQAITTVPSPTVQTTAAALPVPVTVAGVTAVGAPTMRTSTTPAPPTVAGTTGVGTGTGRLFIQDFEQGTAGVTITPGNSVGGTSTAFTSVFTSGGNTIARYSTMSYRGSLSGQWYAALTVGAAYGERVIGSVSDRPVFMRERVMFSAMPDASGVPFAQYVDSAGNVQAEARMMNTGRIGLYSGAGNQIGVSSATYSGMAFADVGLSVKTFHPTAGVIELVIYNAAGVLAETITSSANLDTLRAGGANAFRTGLLRADMMMFSTFTDDVALSTTTYPMLPTATSTWTQPQTVLTTTAITTPTVVAASTAGVVAVTVSTGTAVPAPVVTTGAAPVPAAVAGSTLVPGAALTSTVQAAPPVVAGTTAVGTPTVQSSTAAAPVTVAGTTAAPSAAVQTSGNAIANPGTVAASTAVAAPVVQTAASAVVTAATVQTATGVGAPVVRGGAGTAPATVQTSTTVAAPAVRAGSTATPPVVAATTTVPAPSLDAGNTPTSPAVAASTTVPAPTVTTGSTATPGTVNASTAISGAAGSAQAATPTTVPGTTTVGAVTVRAGAVAVPATVTGLTAAATAQAITSLITAPGTVTGTTVVGGLPSARATTIPPTVPGVTVIGGVFLRLGGAPAPATVQTVTGVGAVRFRGSEVVASTATATITGTALTGYVIGDIPPGRIMQ